MSGGVTSLSGGTFKSSKKKEVFYLEFSGFYCSGSRFIPKEKNRQFNKFVSNSLVELADEFIESSKNKPIIFFNNQETESPYDSYIVILKNKKHRMWPILLVDQENTIGLMSNGWCVWLKNGGPFGNFKKYTIIDLYYKKRQFSCNFCLAPKLRVDLLISMLERAKSCCSEELLATYWETLESY
ncbi:MAG: hypothetical protein WCQ49_01560 [Candidatus Saccharibacteria bacterium]